MEPTAPTTVAELLKKRDQLGPELPREPIPVKMKVADPAAITELLTKTVREFLWADDTLREHAGELVHDIARALANAGCVLIQPDTPAAEEGPVGDESES